MLIEIFIAFLLGILLGVITGIIPGVHINLVSSILISLLGYLSGIEILALITFITSMSITHTFVDFIPSIFLGAPDEDTFLSILPGHQMLKEGKGYEAIILSVYGSLIGLIVILLFLPIFILTLPKIYEPIRKIIPFLLIFISSYILLRDKKVFYATIIFISSGVLGYLSLNSTIQDPLLPLLTGLFGCSSIILSIKNKIKIPKQNIPKLKEIKITKKDFIKSFLGATLFAPLCSFLPGIGSGHAATLSSEIIPNNKKGFIFLLGAINTIVMGLSFVALYSIDRTRSGSAVAIKEITGTLTIESLYFIIFIIILSGIVSALLTKEIAKIVSILINKVNYFYLSISILSFLFIFVFFYLGLMGILILICSTSLGIVCFKIEIRRINLMGCLLLPTMLFYLF